MVYAYSTCCGRTDVGVKTRAQKEEREKEYVQKGILGGLYVVQEASTKEEFVLLT